MLTAAAVLLCLVLLLYWRFCSAKTSKEPPSYPGRLPLIGHAHLFIGDSKHLWKQLSAITKKCLTGQQATTIFIGFRRFYAITDPDDCLKVANSCLQKDVLYDFSKPLFGEGLVTASESVWKEHRKLLNPAFNQKYILGFMGIFNEKARHLIRDLETEVGRAPFDHDPYLRHNAMDAICVSAFGEDFRKNNDLNIRYRHGIETVFDILRERFQKVWLHNPIIWNLTSRKKTLDKHIEELHSISKMIVEKRKKKVQTDENKNFDYTGQEFKPFLDLLFEFNDTSGKEVFSDQVIREQVDTFIVAGHDTVAGTLVFVLLLIASYADVQDKIYAELRDVFGETDRDVNKEDLPRLVYLEAVIKESMRFYPAVPAVARSIKEDVKLKNYTLSSGNSCVLMFAGAHRHPMWGKDREQFRPERWLEPSTLPENPNAFVGFGLGRRVCIARPYAMFFMKTTISHLLRHYRMVGDHLKTVNKFDCMLKPETGHFISLERRTSECKNI